MFDMLKKDDDNLNHVCCEVCNCVHNNQKNECTAKTINVGPHFATNCKDTVCNSFEEKK